MQDLASRFLSARRRRLIGSRPIVDHRVIPSEQDVLSLEQKVGSALPDDMRGWLFNVGFCNIDDDLSIRPEWFRPVEQGHLRGAVLFAQDTLGSFYGFVPSDGRVVFFARYEPAFTVLAPTFRGFLEQIAAHDFKVLEWVESLALAPYEWQQA